jgi:hypothetical protein
MSLITKTAMRGLFLWNKFWSQTYRLFNRSTRRTLLCYPQVRSLWGRFQMENVLIISLHHVFFHLLNKFLLSPKTGRVHCLMPRLCESFWLRAGGAHVEASRKSSRYFCAAIGAATATSRTRRRRRNDDTSEAGASRWWGAAAAKPRGQQPSRRVSGFLRLSPGRMPRLVTQ